MSKLKDLIKKHEAILRNAPQEIDEMQETLEAALVNRCRLWFGEYWDEVKVEKIEMKKSRISIYVTYEGSALEIRFKLNDIPKVITDISEHPLPMFGWGRERFPRPIKDTRIAQIFFDAQTQTRKEE